MGSWSAWWGSGELAELLPFSLAPRLTIIQPFTLGVSSFSPFWGLPSATTSLPSPLACGQSSEWLEKEERSHKMVCVPYIRSHGINGVHSLNHVRPVFKSLEWTSSTWLRRESKALMPRPIHTGLNDLNEDMFRNQTLHQKWTSYFPAL